MLGAILLGLDNCRRTYDKLSSGRLCLAIGVRQLAFEPFHEAFGVNTTVTRIGAAVLRHCHGENGRSESFVGFRGYPHTADIDRLVVLGRFQFLLVEARQPGVPADVRHGLNHPAGNDR